MDFFAAHHNHPGTPAALSPGADAFAHEISRRFSQPLLTARLSPVVSTVSTAPATPAMSSIPPPLLCSLPPAPSPAARLGTLSLSLSPSRASTPATAPADPVLQPVLPAGLHTLLADARPLLVLDIRPHAAFALSRIPHALSLCVPSTLLKRPAFSLQKLADMLPTVSARGHFSAWPSAARILVYDADSSALPNSSNIRGLLRKFYAEDFRGDLLWLKGGFSAVCRESVALVDHSPPSPDDSEDEDDDDGSHPLSSSPSSAPSAPPSTPVFLRTRRLPSSAFQHGSTACANAIPRAPPPSRSASASAFLSPATLPPPHLPLPTKTATAPANPFYDNIRQLRELAHGITERIPLHLPPAVCARRGDLPFEWLRLIVDRAGCDDGTDALAMQFYVIELREQRRLMGVMDHHSRQPADRSGTFPYSITAGFEKGSKNRYTNIWPFEHARVRLNAPSLDDGSDYINASHVQPLGTDRHYIATQGPLPTTYTDFWTLCWEQNVRVIVMLTKEVEGSTVKCGSYWTEATYGPLRLKLVSSSVSENAAAASMPASQPRGFDFGLPSRSTDSGAEEPPLIRRVFLLSHTAHPNAPPRRITQLQYLAWPDYSVPDDPAGLLALVREVDAVRKQDEGSGPVLLHCSAGIGRTGGFIVVDAALDGIRREMRNRSSSSKGKSADKDGEREWDERRLLTASPGPMDTHDDDEGGRDLVSSPHRLRAISPIPRRYQQQRAAATGRLDSSGTDTSEEHSMSPAAAGDVLLPPAPLTHTSLSSSSGSAGSASTSTLLSPSTAPSSLPSLSSPQPLFSPHTPFDCAGPRRLHLGRYGGGDDSTSSSSSRGVGESPPVPLSALGAQPVRRMLEDMREQRMSLCQSLRQYVFVHRAIVEGALALVDEEGAAWRMNEEEEDDDDDNGKVDCHMCVEPEMRHPRRPELSSWMTVKAATTVSATTATPTTLLAKRPSVKRAASANDEEGDGEDGSWGGDWGDVKEGGGRVGGARAKRRSVERRSRASAQGEDEQLR